MADRVTAIRSSEWKLTAYSRFLLVADVRAEETRAAFDGKPTEAEVVQLGLHCSGWDGRFEVARSLDDRFD